MRLTDYFAIVERDLDILNPTSYEKLMLLADYCGVGDGSRVLDVGSGKGYMLRSWAKRWNIDGVALEINPRFVSAEPHFFDVVTCIGAPFAIGTSDEATDWMLRFLKPGGTLALGDVFLKSEPPDALADEYNSSQYRSLIENHDALEERGLTVTGIISASEDEWDRYCSSGWNAIHEWSLENLDHPDREEFVKASDDARREYLAFQKEYLGWAILIGHNG